MKNITKEDIQKLIGGDETVFKAIFNMTYPKLVGFAHKYLDDLMLSEDLVAEVFRKVWERKEKLGIDRSFESFLFTSTRNACLNHIRNASVQKNREELMIQELKDLDVSETIIEENVHFKLYQAIESLPEKMGKVFELSVIHNLKEKEIAEDLGISISTVKVHKQRALKQLREKLGKNYLYIFFL